LLKPPPRSRDYDIPCLPWGKDFSNIHIVNKFDINNEGFKQWKKDVMVYFGINEAMFDLCLTMTDNWWKWQLPLCDWREHRLFVLIQYTIKIKHLTLIE